MTKREGAIISAYTGVLCCDFDDMHKYIEEILGRPVFTHELAMKHITTLIHEKSKPDFLSVVNNLTE